MVNDPGCECINIQTNQYPDSFNRLERFVHSEESARPEIADECIEKLRVAFGNRILKQMNFFVPVYVACGGEELDGIDYVLATKIFRKFESLNLAMLREELRELCTYMNKLFGKNKMNESIAYLERLQKLF